MRQHTVIISSLILCVSACIPNKQLVYLPNPEFNSEAPILVYNRRNVYELQPQDVLSVRIKTLDTDTEDYFNIQADGGFQPINPAGLYVNGYSINSRGMITLPEVGEVKVGGLTLEQAEAKIKEAVGVYVNNTTIFVKLVSFKVTVLGEVNSPGYYFIYNEQATVLEVLGIAGDLTDFGNRENITLVRQTGRGNEAVLLNLKDPDLLASPYYYLQPNDALYVQPLRAKATRSNLNVLTLIFAGVSTGLLILNYIRR
ncbi:MAG: polysaccharide biosynthesis/export family protein [Tunicatimonas sp.]